MTMLRLLGALLFALGFASGPAAAEEADSLTYTVEQGDTLYGIARRYLTGTQAVSELQRINRVANPRRLPVARRLEIPRRLLRFEDIELRVAGFSGNVRINGRQVQQRGEVLREEQIVETAGNSSVSFTTVFGGRISLPSNSRARLIRARRYVLGNTLDVDFAVARGRGSASSPPLDGEDRLRLRTPLAVTAVRGTEFRVAYDAETGTQSLTEVLEGAVEVAAGEEAQAIPAGFGVSSTAQGVSEPEALLPPPELLRPGAIQTGEAIEFAFVPQSAARATRVEIAEDGGFLTILADRVVQEDTIQLAQLPDGRYFVRARSIAASGLEGPSTQVETFRRKRLGVSATAELSPALDGYVFRWLAEGEGEVTFAFQLWRAGEADSPLIDETGLDVTEIVLTDLPPGQYEWRVAAVQADAEDGLLKVWGPAQSFNVSPEGE